MGVRKLSKTRLSNTRHIFDSDDDDFETPAFKNIQSDGDRNTREHNDDDSESNSSGEEVVVEEEEEFEVRSEEDSDDIPEEVTFSQSRAAALAQISSAMKQTRDATAEKRAKRKNQDALFKQQKKTKLEMFVGQKLPDEFLDSLPSEFEKKRRKEDTKPNKPAPDEQCDVNDSETEDVPDNEDFIPLERSHGIKVVSLKDAQPRHKSLAQSAAEFRQNHLYGGHIRRESFRHTRSRIEKRRVCRK